MNLNNFAGADWPVKSLSMVDAILNASGRTMVVVDGAGMIAAASQSWRDVVLAGPSRPGWRVIDATVGANFFAAHAARFCPASGAGIARVLNADLPQFSGEYPCEPLGEQWYAVLAQPLAPGAGAGVVVTYTDVSARIEGQCNPVLTSGHADPGPCVQSDQQRRFDEAAYRKTLVREVHHRIKNTLQGITGILRQFAEQHPAVKEPLNQAIGRVNSISVIHGLLGRAVASSVRLCELTCAIVEEIEALWQTPIIVDIPAGWRPCILAEEEAVPIALIVNELILNAVKHGGQQNGNVRIQLREGKHAGMVRLTIANNGQFLHDPKQVGRGQNGLQLVAALMPGYGARMLREESDGRVGTVLELESPIIFRLPVGPA